MHPQNEPMGTFKPPVSRAENKSSPSKLLVVGAAAIGAVLLIGVGTGGYLLGRSTDESETATASSAAPAVPGSNAAAPAPQTQSRIPVSASDFKIETTVLEQKCFGSAGCNVTYTITPTFLSTPSVLEGRSFKVIYEVNGGKQPEVGHFTLNGTSMRYNDSSRLQTPSADSVLTAQVTSVLES